MIFELLYNKLPAEMNKRERLLKRQLINYLYKLNSEEIDEADSEA